MQVLWVLEMEICFEPLPYLLHLRDISNIDQIKTIAIYLLEVQIYSVIDHEEVNKFFTSTHRQKHLLDHGTIW